MEPEIYMTEKDFIQRYVHNIEQMMWLLGAGASHSAGMPTADKIVLELKRDYYCENEDEAKDSHDFNDPKVQEIIQDYYISKGGLPPEESENEYADCFDFVFNKDVEQQNQRIQKILGENKISPQDSHRTLAHLMAKKKAKMVFTTNFDNVMEDASAQIQENLHTYHLEGTQALMDAYNKGDFPLYAKIHGDFRYRSMKNSKANLTYIDPKMEDCFLLSATRFGLVVSGYSGRDTGVMSMLIKAIEKDNAFHCGLFWTVMSKEDVNGKIEGLIRAAQAKDIRVHIVEIKSFDELLLKIERQIDDKPESYHQLGGDNKVVAPSEQTQSIRLFSYANAFKDCGFSIGVLKGALISAELLGSWDKNGDDVSVIQDLINLEGLDYIKWKATVRSVAAEENSPVGLQRGIWKVHKREELWNDISSSIFDEHLDKFKELSIRVLKGRVDGKDLRYSLDLKKGICDGLALLSVKSNELRNCSRGKSEEVAKSVVEEVLNDPDCDVWANSSELLPILAEAAPELFLQCVNDRIRKTEV